MNNLDPSRRQFLAFVAASPLAAAAGFKAGTLEQLAGQSPRGAERALTLAQQLTQQSAQPALITAAKEALNVFDFEPVAQQKIPIAHWGYLATGSDDDGTICANREGFAH